MSGLFGFFNYDKEGPGVPKNGPKKKTFIVFFEIFFRNFWKFIPINVIFWLISLPILSGGLAKVGITNIGRNTAREMHSFGISDFFETIKKNWKQSLIAGIINAVLIALFVFDIQFFYRNVSGMWGIVGTGISLALLITFIMMGFYLWTLIITFSYTLKQAYSISFKLVFLNFKYSFLCLFINALLLALCVVLLFMTGTAWIYVLMVEILLLICVYPAFNALLVQFCTFPSIKKFIIDPYYKAHPNEDIEKRRRLGLDIEDETKPTTPAEDTAEEDDEEDDGVIFND